MGAVAIDDRIFDQVAQRAADLLGTDEGDGAIAVDHVDRRSQLDEILHDGIGERGQVDLLRRLAAAAGAGEREDVVEHPVHFLDRLRHAGAFALILDRFGADPQRGERGAQIMADGTQHPVLLVQHRDDARAHGVEGGGELAHIARPAFFDRIGRTGPCELTGGAGQLLERAGEAAAHPEQRNEDDDVEDQRLGHQPAAKARRAATDAGHRGHPFARFIFDRQREAAQTTIARLLSRRATAYLFPATLRHDATIFCRDHRMDGQADILKHGDGSRLDIWSRLAGKDRPRRRKFHIAPVTFLFLLVIAALRPTIGPDIECVDDPINDRRGLAGQFDPIAFAQQQAEIDRLRHEQRDRDQDDDLSDQTLRPEAQLLHSLRTSADRV